MTPEPLPPPWWQTFDDPSAKALAARLANADGFPAEAMALPFVPQVHAIPACGTVALIPDNVAAPIWTFYLNAARHCMEVHAAMLVDQAVGTAADDMIAAQHRQPRSDDQLWRDEKGLPHGDEIT